MNPADLPPVNPVLEWFEPRRAAYPWRMPKPDGYRTLVSEVMLQQTQAPRVAPAFRAFLERFPTVTALAGAPRSDVLRSWGMLGYNRRALALSEAARSIVAEHGGEVPSDPRALRNLPGVGPYTAAAVASIAYGVPVPAVDTNVSRVVSRAVLGREPGELSRSEVAAAAEGWLDRGDPGTWNQALMDLGRVVCRPIPRCDACPLADACRWQASSHVAARRPRRQGTFAGSARQARGAVLRALRERDPRSVAALARATKLPDEPVLHAIRTLHADGLVLASPAALDGRPRSFVRLPA